MKLENPLRLSALMMLIIFTTVTGKPSFPYTFYEYIYESSTEHSFKSYARSTTSAKRELTPKTTVTPRTTTFEKVYPLTEMQTEWSSIVFETDSIIQETCLRLHRIKTFMEIKYLSETIPSIESIQGNMTSLLNTRGISYATYKGRNDHLENELLQIEHKLTADRLHIEKYIRAYQNAKEALREVLKTIKNVH